MDGISMMGSLKFTALRIRQAQHALEHCRHPQGVGDFLADQESERFCGVKPVHDGNAPTSRKEGQANLSGAA